MPEYRDDVIPQHHNHVTVRAVDLRFMIHLRAEQARVAQEARMVEEARIAAAELGQADN